MKLRSLSTLWSALKREAPQKDPAATGFSAATPEGLVVGAVGDIHGRADLLEPLLEVMMVRLDAAGEGRAKLVFLGDYVDRGRDSRGVLDIILGLSGGAVEVIALMGNHEDALLRFLDDPSMGEAWVAHGGAATLLSYGVVVPSAPAERDWGAIRDEFATALPAEHLAFLRSMRLSYACGDYFFCHAGARPGVPLDQQSKEDLLWIRRDFLIDTQPFEKVIVHGHTPQENISADARRIGLDTGAYATGALSAACFSGAYREFFSTGGHVGLAR